jgi:hypothetical protein
VPSPLVTEMLARVIPGIVAAALVVITSSESSDVTGARKVSATVVIRSANSGSSIQ